MRILEVTQRYPPALGGVEIDVAAIARRLAELGHEVEVVTTDLDRDRPFRRLRAVPTSDPFPVRRHRAFRTIPMPHGLGIVAPGMARDVWSSRADVVHAHAFGMAPTWLAAADPRRRTPPLVVETHMDAGRGTPGWWAFARAVTRWTLQRADRVVAHTQLERRLLTSLGVVPDRIVQIPNGIDLAEFSGRSPRVPPGAGGTVLFVGRLDPVQKGLGPLIRGFAKVPPELRLSLRLVGEDWGGAALVSRLARQLGVQGRVTLTGALPRRQLIEEYARADVLVLPSSFEPFGIVLLEAMAAGLPIVATRVGGIPEVVSEGENAILCAPDDDQSLADALERLARDPTLRGRFARSGLQRVEGFSWNQVMPRWIRLFEEVVGGSNSRAGFRP